MSEATEKKGKWLVARKDLNTQHKRKFLCPICL